MSRYVNVAEICVISLGTESEDLRPDVFNAVPFDLVPLCCIHTPMSRSLLGWIWKLCVIEWAIVTSIFLKQTAFLHPWSHSVNFFCTGALVNLLSESTSGKRTLRRQSKLLALFFCGKVVDWWRGQHLLRDETVRPGTLAVRWMGCVRCYLPGLNGLNALITVEM